MPSSNFVVLDVPGWLYGTVRSMNPYRRGIFADLLVLSKAGRFPGWIAAGYEGEKLVGYSLRQLAKLINCPHQQLKRALDEFVAEGRLERNETGALRITGWDRYQLIPSDAGEDRGGGPGAVRVQAGCRVGAGWVRDDIDRTQPTLHPAPGPAGQNEPTGGQKLGSTADTILENTIGQVGYGSVDARKRAHSLALLFWQLQGNPVRHKKAIPSWEEAISALLKEEPALDGLLECLFSRDLPYWSSAWDEGSPDPMAFLLKKLAVPVEERGSIRQTWDEVQSRKAVARAKAARKEKAEAPASEALKSPEEVQRLLLTVENGINLGLAYWEAHEKEYESRPDWAKEIKWRVDERNRLSSGK